MKYYEVEFSDGFSIACKGERIPTISEANLFHESDVKKFSHVVSVVELDLNEVYTFFDTDNIDNWPVFK